ncbi:FACT complex subunit SPT16 [Pluteus cervinus]|uniref:FACT complex subunit SPT16 n=1 Tax=Pluteus cervinus TaxID=181527 RepID=A0ACD3AQT0_9AGAR|nr:FACT complex subunit SPT16 [Pluteus cervinus]
MSIQLNKAAFTARIDRIYEDWKTANKNDDYASVADVDAFVLLAGDPASEDEPPRKSTCFQQWLLGYEFPSTFILFQKDKILILCSPSKAKILSQIQGDSLIPVEILAQAKAKEPPNDALPRFFNAYESHSRIGALLKDAQSGKLLAEWDKLVSASGRVPELIDISPAISTFMSVKDEEELKSTRTAATLTSTLLKHYVASQLESILDKATKVSHETFAARVEARIGSGEGPSSKPPDTKVWSKAKGIENIDWQMVEFAYPAIIISQSSKTGYDLRYTAKSTDDNIADTGVFLVAFGLRYKSYSANIGRTFIVDPHPAQEEQYNLLLTLQSELLSFVKAGVSCRDVYQHALSYVKDHKPELEKDFIKAVGWGMGLEFRDAAYLLSPKNSRRVKADMIFNLTLGFNDLEANGRKYSLLLTDTIKVEATKSTLITEGTKQPRDTLFFLNQEEEEEKPKKTASTQRANGSPSKVKTVAGKVLRNQTRRAAHDEVNQTATAKLADHQRELHERLQTAGLEKYAEGDASGGAKEGKGWKKFQSYKGEAALPPEINKLRVVVDRKAQTVILPMNGFAVAFHINTIKNVSKNDEGEFTYLRVNFQTPGQLAGKKEDTPFENPDATFVRSVTYRSTDGHRFDGVFKQITELKKEANKREQQKKEMADVVEQGSLVELKGRRPHKLPEVFVRPALDGKRLPGEVEIHQNGLRYQSPLGSQKIDILFSNVKHLFFQPCDHELLVIVHLHLKAPIMIGKKKTSDVQFFREASDVQFDETGNRKRKHRYGDEDEVEMEQQERKRRALLNKEFKAFAEKVAEAASAVNGDPLELDIPFRELSFEGVPFRTGVRLQPTTECLVHLTDPPFLVVTLADIEIASLERVQYGLRQFDLVLVFKDFTRSPLHINSIQSSQMDDVKNWLDSVDIPMSEGPVNLNWGPIMKHVNENPFDFFQQGGWSFLGGAGGPESDHSDGSESESEFEAEGAESEYSSEESDAYSDGTGSDDEGSDFGDGDDSEDGDDWEELERKAAKADLKRADNKKKAGDSDSDEERPKKKSTSKGGKTNGKPAGKARR